MVGNEDRGLGKEDAKAGFGKHTCRGEREETKQDIRAIQHPYRGTFSIPELKP